VSDQRLKIDKPGVLDVGAQLRATADNDVTPRGDRIKQDFMYHSVFGERSGSPTVQAAATQYFAQMRAAVDFLEGLAERVGVMAQAAQDVVAAYQHADTLSAHDVDAVINDAWTKVQVETATAAAQDRAADAEDRQADLAQMTDLRDIKRGAA
jgi:hypothetical protein